MPSGGVYQQFIFKLVKTEVGIEGHSERTDYQGQIMRWKPAGAPCTVSIMTTSQCVPALNDLLPDPSSVWEERPSPSVTVSTSVPGSSRLDMKNLWSEESRNHLVWSSSAGSSGWTAEPSCPSEETCGLLYLLPPLVSEHTELMTGEGWNVDWRINRKLCLLSVWAAHPPPHTSPVKPLNYCWRGINLPVHFMLHLTWTRPRCCSPSALIRRNKGE